MLLQGTLKDAASPYGQVLDVNHITEASSFPLELFTTTIHEKNYIAAKCAAADKTWRLQVKWTYNNGSSKTVKRTQPCTVG